MLPLSAKAENMTQNLMKVDAYLIKTREAYTYRIC